MCISLDSPNEYYSRTDNRKKNMELLIEHGQRKTFPIEYVVVTDENIEAAAKWSGGNVGEETVPADGDTPEKKISFVRVNDQNAMNTRQKKAYVGDVIVHHLELKSFKAFGVKSFNKSYDAIDIRELNRDATTGEIVTHAFAVENPETTVTEQVEFARRFDPDTSQLTATEKEADKNAALPRDAGLD